jgi:hypothetical protein
MGEGVSITVQIADKKPVEYQIRQSVDGKRVRVSLTRRGEVIEEILTNDLNTLHAFMQNAFDHIVGDCTCVLITSRKASGLEW